MPLYISVFDVRVSMRLLLSYVLVVIVIVGLCETINYVTYTVVWKFS